MAAPPEHRRPSARGGFTLIELLIAIAIMAVMLVVVVKMNRSLLPENELSGATNDLATSIEFARSEAILGGRRVFFEFRLGRNADETQYFRSIQEPLPGHEKDAEDDEYLLTVREWKALPRDVRIDSIVLGETEPYVNGDVQVAIQPDGKMPSHLIRLWARSMDPDKSRANGWSCVQVSGLLGQARVLNRFVEPQFLREDTFQ